MGNLKLIDVNANNVDEYGFFCSKNKKYPGYQQKLKWLQGRFAEGLRIKLLHDAEGKDVGFVEYIPGEHAWRPVAAEGYFYIHCIYVARKPNREQGNGRLLLEACLRDAEKENKLGVVASTSEGVWIAGRSLFEKNGYVVADRKGRFDLLVNQLREGPPPSFRNWEEPLAKIKGWQLIFSQQCPFHEKAVHALYNEAVEAGIHLEIVELTSAKEAQVSPSGFGTFSLVRDGKLLADHYISATRFRNILKEELR